MLTGRVIFRFARGQVWWLRESKEETEKKINDPSNFILAKSRPWLIVSCQENNENAHILNIIPISLSRDESLPNHVSYAIGRDPSPKTVLCEQITTVNAKDFANRANYMYSLSDELMERVSVSLINQLGGFPEFNSISNLLPLLQKVIKTAAEKELLTSHIEELSSKVLGISESLQSILLSSTQNPLSQSELLSVLGGTNIPYIKPRNPNQRQEDDEIPQDSIESASESESEEETGDADDSQNILSESTSPIPSTRRRRFTPDEKLQFIVDLDTLSRDEMMSKWKLHSYKDLISTKSRFIKALNLK